MRAVAHLRPYPTGRARSCHSRRAGLHPASTLSSPPLPLAVASAACAAPHATIAPGSTRVRAAVGTAAATGGRRPRRLQRVATAMEAAVAERERLARWAGAAGEGLLDVRDGASSPTAGTSLRCSVHIPSGSLAGRSFLLPHKAAAMSVLADDRVEVEFLLEQGYNVTDIFIASQQLFAAADALGLLERPGAAAGPLADKPDYLWQPSGFVARALPVAMRGIEGGRRPRVVDFGCGSGRDAAFAALAGCQVAAVDSAAPALVRAAAVADAHGVGSEVVGLHLDLRKVSPAEALRAAEEALGGKVDIVIGVRFLHRPLLEELPVLLRNQGACVLWSHFSIPEGSW